MDVVDGAMEMRCRKRMLRTERADSNRTGEVVVAVAATVVVEVENNKSSRRSNSCKTSRSGNSGSRCPAVDKSVVL